MDSRESSPEILQLARASYHALSGVFRQRARHGLTFDASYTWSHTIDNGTNEFFTSLLNPRRAQDTNRLDEDRSNSDLDVRHKFSLSWIWEIPKTKTENGFMKALFNGYQLGSVFLAQSGQPVTIQSGIDANGNGDTAGDRAVFNPFGHVEYGLGRDSGLCVDGGFNFRYSGRKHLSGAGFGAQQHQPDEWMRGQSGERFGFDPAIGYTPVDPTSRYVIAGPGVRTTVGRNNLNTPGFAVLNLSIFKNTYLSETKFLQLRAEFFNVLNHPNYSLSNGNVFSTAGIVAATSAPGYAQVGSPDF